MIAGIGLGIFLTIVILVIIASAYLIGHSQGRRDEEKQDRKGGEG